MVRKAARLRRHPSPLLKRDQRAGYAYYAKAGGGKAWLERASTVSWGNLSLTPEGRGSAAHVYPFSTNGVRGKRNDTWANDQDWALIHLLMIREIDAL